ncbi:hypothetical protein [Rhodohalobacter mucosus]|uniref:Hydroxyneurosporene synthase (CrtC) n=1 Tax=Rhodohalobacter mucosus TaxID=2079485 RepID=A0A316TS56_9BACT|nr:hypothetical protein [Rhodohalobacter mucosus]PWN07220.1 hypothetical protein DDZ15_05320 [Rhodohalobacter mucosus]
MPEHILISLKKRLYLTFFLHLLLLGGNASYAQIDNPEGGLTTVPDELIWAQTLSGSHFNEFWNYQFYFDNGMKAHILFSVANFGSLKDPVSGVRFSILYPDGSTYHVSREYPLHMLIQDRETHMFRPRLERELYFVGKLPDEHKIVIDTPKDGISYQIELTFTNIARGYKWADGMFDIHNEEIGIVTHIPYAEVSGFISVDGDRRQVDGTGYMDHTFQNQTTTRLMNSGYRFVNHTDSRNWDLLYFLLPADNRGRSTAGYRLKSENGRVSVQGIEAIQETHDSEAFGKSIPRIMELELENGGSLRLYRTEDEERFSVLSELNWLARRAAKSFLGGEVIDFRGDATLQEPSNRPKQGHYNYFFVE